MTLDITTQTVVERIQTFLHTSPPTTTVVGICGLGGAGKSTLCKAVQHGLQEQTIIFEIDWYLSPSAERRNVVLDLLKNQDTVQLSFWENPINWYDWNRLLFDLHTLTQHRKLSILNAWNQSSGRCDKQLELHLPSTPNVILIDGLYLLHEPIRHLIEYVFMLDTSKKISMARASKRDQHRKIDSITLKFLIKSRFSTHNKCSFLSIETTESRVNPSSSRFIHSFSMFCCFLWIRRAKPK